MADEFDPDNFDWDEPGLGEADVQIFDVLRKTALSALVRLDPIRYVRPTAHDEDRPRPIFINRYALQPDQKPHLDAVTGGWIVDENQARLNHDHPISHIARELQEYEMVEPFRYEAYIDMHGNPGRNAKYSRNCITMGGVYTPKGALRYFYKRGMVPVDIDGIIAGKYSDSKNISNTHALYYESLDTIGRLCQAGFMYHALIHRHDKAHGFLNFGEQEYWVDMNGTVRQQNVRTGEEYSHPTCEPFFHQSTAITSSGGITWDIRQAGPDSYVLRFVACPVTMCEKFRTLGQLASSDASIVVVDDVTVHSFLGYKWYTKGSGKSEVRLADSDLLEKLRRYIAGRKRTPEQKENLMNFCRRNCNKNDVISVHSGVWHRVPPEHMTDYVNTAFYMDIEHELESAIYFETKYSTMKKALNEYYEKGTLPTHIYTPSEVTRAVSAAVVGAKNAITSISPQLFNIPNEPSVVDWASPKLRSKTTMYKTVNGHLVRDGWKEVWRNAVKV